MQTTKVLVDLWQRFGRKVRERREELGLTQEAAGKRAQMKRQQWNRIEQGASTKRPTLFRIAKALKLEPEIVLDWAGFKLDGGNVQAETVEDALDAALFFHRKGLSESDKAELRPLLKVADREIERLRKMKESEPVRTIRPESIKDLEKLFGRTPIEELNDLPARPGSRKRGAK